MDDRMKTVLMSVSLILQLKHIVVICELWQTFSLKQRALLKKKGNQTYPDIIL